MKNVYKIISILLISSSLIFFGCEDRSDLTAPSKPSTGDANFKTFVSIGNSLTAGYQSSALYKSAQIYSFGNLIAEQVGTDYVQPLLTDPGVGGRIEVKSISPFETTTNTQVGQLENATYSKPYNNLGVPGALLADVLQAKDASTSISGDNLFFDIILRGQGTVLEQVAALKPTFITLWIGNNDILGYATRGGTVPHTPVDLFPQIYAQLAGAITQTGAKVVVANIPDVTAIPFFRTVGPLVAQAIKPAVDAGLAFGLFYNTNGQLGPADQTSLLTPDALLNGTAFLPLTLSSFGYADLIGQPTGKFYRDNGITDPSVLGIDTTQAFGLHPLNPIPDAFILDPSEIAEANSVITSFNQSIASIANANGWALFDAFAFFSNVAKNGIVVNGVKYTTEFVNGGLFSLDGVHPTSQGYAIIANKFIEAINAKFKAKIPSINVSTIPGSLVLAKKVTFDKYGYPKFDKHAFDHLLY